MRNVAMMTLDEIVDELKQLESTPLGKRTPYDAHRMRELRAAKKQIWRSVGWWR